MSAPARRSLGDRPRPRCGGTLPGVNAASPLPRLWWTSGSHPGLWAGHGTYNAVPYDLLPPLPARRGGALAWLSEAPSVAGGLDLSGRS